MASLALALAVLSGGASAGEGHAEATVNARVFVNPLNIELTLSASEARVGQLVRARATASNLGPEPIVGAAMTIRSDPEGVRIAGSATRVVAEVGAGDGQMLTWQLCGTRPGSYVLLARASYVNAAGDLVTSESSASVLTISSGDAGKCPGSRWRPGPALRGRRAPGVPVPAAAVVVLWDVDLHERASADSSSAGYGDAPVIGPCLPVAARSRVGPERVRPIGSVLEEVAG